MCCVCVCCMCVCYVCLCPNTNHMHKTHYVYIYTQSDSLQLRALRLVHQKASVRHRSHSTAECWQSTDLHNWLRLVWTKASGSKGPYAHPARTLPAKRKQGMVHACEVIWAKLPLLQPFPFRDIIQLNLIKFNLDYNALLNT